MGLADLFDIAYALDDEVMHDGRTLDVREPGRLPQQPFPEDHQVFK
jgi:hypothetical protein